ncbi:hypothetical protein NARC_30225 [Candidatus Nitrosocosmicus arcticus]|uniref:Uncharacterized protein n=1 Tax=Candidatus Nitrosocosmicus arcticus TaxID=2035267 RepID=A0A557SY24_9ARCH|nr:hypothetical protein NARC_30225 [Candidatus Nitrosocosmicus arcticus]
MSVISYRLVNNLAEFILIKSFVIFHEKQYPISKISDYRYSLNK